MSHKSGLFLKRPFKKLNSKEEPFIEEPASIAVDVALSNTTPFPEKIQETHFF
ncbi:MULTISPECIES: hypothetical protein [Acetobacter]|uniref:hypothetical protein n=1 Tax=Acetobacter TaxID=434 RepID=UPI0012FD2E23|nr:MULTISPECIES: hypothetical protein [Acetobacter]